MNFPRVIKIVSPTQLLSISFFAASYLQLSSTLNLFYLPIVKSNTQEELILRTQTHLNTSTLELQLKQVSMERVFWL